MKNMGFQHMNLKGKRMEVNVTLQYKHTYSYIELNYWWESLDISTLYRSIINLAKHRKFFNRRVSEHSDKLWLRV